MSPIDIADPSIASLISTTLLIILTVLTQRNSTRTKEAREAVTAARGDVAAARDDVKAAANTAAEDVKAAANTAAVNAESAALAAADTARIARDIGEALHASPRPSPPDNRL